MIAALLSSRVRTWVLLSVAAPIGAWALEQAADEAERRHGDSRTTRTLRRASGAADQISRRRRRNADRGKSSTPPR